ncbi:MBL fold metallo-hydrolase [Mesobacillus maritimus]|uniref:MBL fold metallo-hydrolase n=1 Tax=Mesobacillus maritimus TaxID=1643336 RepID=UPI002041B481|nr:MBL fold metallo-hydrolase [Mesobacillus maritimus]MCM3586253.1 MBL fold metallo-hydrolase [Mesobacillus maritimus]
MFKKTIHLVENIYLIDGYDLGIAERTGSYVIKEKDITLIETSASPSIPHILQGLRELDIAPEDIKNVIVTHIHLDHSGGVGLLLQHCPNAKVIVHPKGARHLANPSKLIASAKTVYGEKFDTLFDPILPVPEDRIEVKNDLETLKIGDDCVLTFFDTPGHANHHFSIFHPKVEGIFTGDTAGIYYPQLHRKGIEFYLPTTSPNQFDPSKMLQSIALFKSLKPKRLFFGHYGMSESPAEAFVQVEGELELFVSEAKLAFEEEKDFQAQSKLVTTRLYERLKNHLHTQGIEKGDPILDLLSLDLEVSGMGLIDYMSKQNR